MDPSAIEFYAARSTLVQAGVSFHVMHTIRNALSDLVSLSPTSSLSFTPFVPTSDVQSTVTSVSVPLGEQGSTDVPMVENGCDTDILVVSSVLPF